MQVFFLEEPFRTVSLVLICSLSELTRFFLLFRVLIIAFRPE